MYRPRILHVLLAMTITVAFSVQTVNADSFDRYRNVIDNYKDYTKSQRDEAIRELEKLKTSNIEKAYLLGMLNFIQGMESMVSIARSKAKKPRIEEVLKDPTVQGYYQAAERYYDEVEYSQSGYENIYCKYAELYSFSYNEQGLKKLTEIMGQAEKNERTEQCKGIIENTAEKYAARGRMQIPRTIFHAAIKNWNPYPKYMLEAMGDIERVLKNHAEAEIWWKRCIEEAESKEREGRCRKKLQKGT